MLSTEKKKVIYKNMLYIRNYVPYYGFTGTMIQIVFLKYLCSFDNDMLGPLDLKLLIKYQRMLMSGEIQFEVISEVYSMIGNLYNDRSRILNTAIDSLHRAFANDSRALVQAINMTELPSEEEDLTELLLYIISQGESGDISKTGINTTNSSLIELTKKILDVKVTDSFIDCFCGFSKTLLSVNADFYQGYEINHEVTAIAFMSMIMSGKRNFKIDNQDYYSIEHETKYDKVFADGPLALTMKDEYNFKYGFGKRSDAYNILLPLMDLKDHGKAVLTCVANVLYSNQKSLIDMRKNIILDLIAVVALPPLWSGVSINTNILVFEKGNNNENIVFVDASNWGTLNKQSRQYFLNEDTINMILNSINGEIIHGFSNMISKKDILANEISLHPFRYVEKKDTVNCRKVSEINNELDKVYTELFELIKE